MKLQRLILSGLLGAAMAFGVAAAPAQATFTKVEAFEHLRGRCCSGNDDDIHNYGVRKGLAGFQVASYYYRANDSTVWLMLDFVTWQGYMHTTCGKAWQGDGGSDYIVDGPKPYGCGNVPYWTPTGWSIGQP